MEKHSLHYEFVPYEESLELKELGFDEPCLAINNGDKLFYGAFKNTHEYYKENAVILYQQAFRWFREKYNLEYQIIKSANGNYSVVIHLNTQEYLNKISTLQHACLDEIVDCYSYEEAELACLIKLIEIAKQK
jgi:predicted transcriptional regulator